MLSLVFLLAFFAAGATFIMRKLVPQLWLMVKPWSCDLCMSWWSAWLGVVIKSVNDYVPLDQAIFAVPASVGLSVLMVKAANRLGE